MMRSPAKALVLAATASAALSLTGQAHATVLLQDTFALGSRPNAAGNPVTVNVGTSLAGKQAQVPGTPAESWITNGAPGTPSWAFSASSPDPFETPAPGGNGTVTYLQGDEIPGRPATATAVLAFAPPTSAFQESLDVVAGRVGPGITIGFTTSTTAGPDSFGSLGEIFLTLQSSAGQGNLAAWTLGTAGGQTLSGTTTLLGFNRLILSYDPITDAVLGSVNGVLTGPLTFDADGISAVGFTGAGTVDNFRVETGALAGGGAAVPEPEAWALMLAGFGAVGAVLRRDRRAVVAD